MEGEFSEQNKPYRENDFASTSKKHTDDNTENDSLTKTRTPSNSFVIHVLTMCFAISASAGVSGLFNEVPLLVNTAPEGARLMSYFVIILQSANVTALLYLIARKLFKRTRDFLLILTLLCSATVGMILLALYHQVTVRVGNSRYSLVFLALVFVVGMIRASSQVLMVPFIRHFNEKHMLSFFVGQGAADSTIGLIVLFQGDSTKECTEDGPVVVSNVNFSVRSFFFFIASLHVLSLSAFLVLQYYRTIWKRAKLANNCTESREDILVEGSIESIDDSRGNVISTSKKFFYYALLALIPFFAPGFLDAISPFATLPYGNSTYRMALVLSVWSDLITCTMTLWIIPLCRWLIKYVLIALLVSYVYIVCLAIISPNVPLENSFMGHFAIVTAYVTLFASAKYINLVIIMTFRAHEDSKSLVYAGACVQFGEATGGIVAFILTNFTTIFEYETKC